MDWVAAKAYYIGYNSIQRFDSIVFIHNYFVTWSISLVFSLILPLLFLFAPSSLHTTRTAHFLLICIVCLSNMCCLYVQLYMISGPAEPNLSYHPCRLIVYISTFAKPIGIYLTFLFSLERLVQKILSKLFLRTNPQRQLFRRLFQLLIFLGTILIFSIRLYEVLKLIPRKQSSVQQTSDDGDDPLEYVSDPSSNSTDRYITFQYCFNSMNIDTYAQILSFYVIQYWFEYAAIIIIILLFLILFVQQYRLPPLSSRFSVNTKLSLSLSLSVIVSELILLFFHFIVDDINNDRAVQLPALQFMLFAFHFRCIFLPFMICITTCDPLKEFLYQLVILRPYLENIDENDNMDNRPEPFSTTPRTSNRLQQKFRRTFTKNNNNNNNNNEHLENNDSQEDL